MINGINKFSQSRNSEEMESKGVGSGSFLERLLKKANETPPVNPFSKQIQSKVKDEVNQSIPNLGLGIEMLDQSRRPITGTGNRGASMIKPEVQTSAKAEVKPSSPVKARTVLATGKTYNFSKTILPEVVKKQDLVEEKPRSTLLPLRQEERSDWERFLEIFKEEIEEMRDLIDPDHKMFYDTFCLFLYRSNSLG